MAAWASWLPFFVLCPSFASDTQSPLLVIGRRHLKLLHLGSSTQPSLRKLQQVMRLHSMLRNPPARKSRLKSKTCILLGLLSVMRSGIRGCGMASARHHCTATVVYTRTEALTFESSSSRRLPLIPSSHSTPTMAAPYRSYIQPEADAEFPAEAGRYHLYVTYSCPFACRALAARNLKGLHDVISLSVAHPIFQKTKPNDAEDTHLGWTFVDPATEPTIKGVNGNEYSTEGATTDPINHVRFVRDLYELVDKEPRRYTVPLLWDKKKQTIVSNESADILRTLNTGFRELVPSNVDLLPEPLKAEVEAVNEGIVAEIGSGFYRARTKPADEYEVEIAIVFASVARLDELLAKSRYLVGSGITEADVRLFHTLIRFDLYQRSTSKQNLTQFPNVVNYLRDLYQTPGLKSTVDWAHLKIGGVNHNPEAPLPEGPFVDYDAAHDRSRL